MSAERICYKLLRRMFSDSRLAIDTCRKSSASWATPQRRCWHERGHGTTHPSVNSSTSGAYLWLAVFRWLQKDAVAGAWYAEKINATAAGGPAR